MANTANTLNVPFIVSSVKGRLGFIVSLAIFALIFFGGFSYQKFNDVRTTMTVFQTELKEKRSKVSDQQKAISQQKSEFSLKKQKISFEMADLSKKKIVISRKKEDMIEKSFQTGKKSGIVYLALESMAKTQRYLWRHAFWRTLKGKDTGLIAEMQKLKKERSNLLRAFFYLKTQTASEKAAKDKFYAYIKKVIKPLLKTSVLSIHQGKMKKFESLKADIPERFDALKELGHSLIENINEQTKKFDQLREELRNKEEDFIAKEKEMGEKEQEFIAKEEQLKGMETLLNKEEKQLEKEGDAHLASLSSDIDVALNTIFAILIVTIIALTIGGILLARSITRPIDSLKKSADQLASGNLEEEIDTMRKDEVGQLAISFDQMRNSISKKLSDLSILNHTGEKLAGMINEGIVLKTALQVMQTQTNVTTGSIYLLDDNNMLTLSAYYPEKEGGSDDDNEVRHLPKSFSMNEGIAGHVATTMQSVFIPNAVDAPAYVTSGSDNPRALLCVPMMDDKRIFGVMNFSGEVGEVTFEEGDEGFALTIARMTVITTKNIQMVAVIEEQNRTLEQKVLERTTELRQKTNDINSMLQNMQQGIFTIVQGAVIHPEYSAYLESIFDQTDLTGLEALPFLFGDSDVGSNDLNQIEAALGSLIGEDSMMFEFNSHLLVTEYQKTLASGKEMILELDWNAVLDDDDVIDKVMVTVRDVTELRALERDAEKQKEELEIIGNILSLSPQKFKDFVKSSKEFITENGALISATKEKNIDVIATLFRNMHTIKGNARTYGMNFITDVVHETETTYDRLRKEADFEWKQDALLSDLDDVSKSIGRYETVYENKLAGFAGKTGKFIEEKLLKHITNALEEAKVANQVAELQRNVNTIAETLNAVGTEDISDVIEDILGGLPAMATDLQKELPEVMINSNDIRLKEEISPILKDIFMHAFRNSMDHGLEIPEVREQSGKRKNGLIQLDLEIKGGILNISYKDDGKGLGLAFIHKKAVENGIFEPEQQVTDEEIAELIFHSGLSTAEKVTTVSGRGVGMDAIRRFVQRQGGDIKLEFLAPRDANGCRPFSQTITLPQKNCVKLAL